MLKFSFDKICLITHFKEERILLPIDSYNGFPVLSLAPVNDYPVNYTF